MNIREESLQKHYEWQGKLEVTIRVACSADNLKGLALSLKAHIEAYFAACYATNVYARQPKDNRQEQKA